MSSASDYLENKLLDHTLRNAAFTQPAGLYLALYTVLEDDAGGGTELPVANGYARQSVTMGNAAGGVASNTNTITFTAAGGNWGTIVRTAIFDAVSGGNLLTHSALTPNRIINDTDQLKLDPGDLDVSID